MTTNQYYNQFFPYALRTTSSPQKALYLLSQSAMETGLLASTSIYWTTNNMFGITKGDWTGKTVGGFRCYDSYADSMVDWRNLMQKNSAYSNCYNAPDIGGFAKIAYTPYITDADGRAAYEKAVTNYYGKFDSLYNDDVLLLLTGGGLSLAALFTAIFWR